MNYQNRKYRIASIHVLYFAARSCCCLHRSPLWTSLYLYHIPLSAFVCFSYKSARFASDQRSNFVKCTCTSLKAAGVEVAMLTNGKLLKLLDESNLNLYDRPKSSKFFQKNWIRFSCNIFLFELYEISHL